jgi:hypothetical protein
VALQSSSRFEVRDVEITGEPLLIWRLPAFSGTNMRGETEISKGKQAIN